jgi:tungstate transport system substrate-binding protein
MKKVIPWSLFFILLTASICSSEAFATNGCTQLYGKGSPVFSVATGSPGELGLLRTVGEYFSRETGTSLCWVKAGSGESFKLLQSKKVDVILVHSPAAEEKAVQEGWAAKRTLLGFNEFYLVGPPEDPAQTAGAARTAEAFRRIAVKKAVFFSRGDDSGTHLKEMAIWSQAGIQPSGEWYRVTRDFMGASLKKAHDERGYFLTDSSTWVMHKAILPHLKILFKGDPFLINAYHGLCQPSGATPGADIGAKFLNFLASVRGQQLIREFGQDVYGEGLYYDAAWIGHSLK